MTKRRTIAAGLALVGTAGLLVTGAVTQLSPADAGDRAIRIAVFNGWDEGIAASELWKSVLEDEGFRLTECSAILKYLADKVNSPAYPKDLKQRAKVNEMMDWLNTQFYREYGYGFIYPQIFPNNKRPTEAAQQACLEWSKERAQNWLKILDQHWIGPKNQYLCGSQITIADYLGAGFVSLGEIIRMDFASYPNVRRWLGNMKKLKSWPSVNEVFYGFQGMLKDQKFETLQ